MEVSQLSKLVAIGLFGAVGALLRHAANIWIGNSHFFYVPRATLIVNVIGAYSFGVLIQTITLRYPVEPDWKPILLTGFLGSLTTFSTLSYESYELFQQEKWIAFLLTSFGQITIGILCVYLGVRTSNLLFST